MEGIREYILGIICAAIICGIATALVGKSGSVGMAMKLLYGLIMVLVVLLPWTKGKMLDFSIYMDSLKEDAEHAVQQGCAYSESAMEEIIKQNVSTYILDKATSLGVNVTVEVQLSEDSPQLPIGVTISGDISPYARKVLSADIENALGISAEEQQWS